MKGDFFEESGRLGGRTRARNLSPERRSEIASRAASARWKRPHGEMMKSVRLNTPDLADPAYLEEVLLEGSLRDWRRVYEEISDRPFGPIAESLKRVLSSSRYYGVTPLWHGILRSVQGMPQS
jgi:hypothetical protein